MKDQVASKGQYDLIVVGAGAGGMGAAITAGREGMWVLWIERERRLGGTGVNAYVNVYQPAYTASPLAREICELLLDSGEARFLGCRTDTPSRRPIYRITQDATYEGTIEARYQADDSAPLIVYTPDGMDALLREMATETGRIDLWDRTVLLDAHTEPSAEGLRRITSVDVQRSSGRQTVTAPWFIDATADIYLARRAGCSWYMGREPRDMYDEPSAAPWREFKLNAWTLCFLVREGPDLIVGDPGRGPDSDWAHHALGRMYASRGWVPGAIREFRSAVAANPQHLNSWCQLGMLYVRARRAVDAADAFEHIVQLTPRDTGVWNDLCVAYMVSDRLDEALEAFDRALAMAPKDVGLHYNLGNLHRKRGLPHEALAAYRQALSLEPENTRIRAAVDRLERDLAADAE